MINYKVLGEGIPIYFIHGNNLSLESMEIIYEPLFKDSNYMRIYIDLTGMGDSKANYNIDSSSKIIEILLQKIDELTSNQKFYLVGHSYGGYLSLGINQVREDDVLGLFLTCPVVYAKNNERIKASHKNFYEENLNIEDELFEDYLNMNVVINRNTWEMYQRIIKSGIEKCDMEYNEFLGREENKYYKLENESEIFNTSNRLTLVLGLYDNVVGYKDQISKALDSNFELHLLSNAGHNLMIDDTRFLQFIAKKFWDL